MDKSTAARQADLFSLSNRHEEAIRLYRQLVSQTHVASSEYDAWLKGMARSLAATGARRSAAYLHLYLLQFDRALSMLGQDDALVEALVLDQQGRHAEAAVRYSALERHLLAAIAFERVGMDAEAQGLWELGRDRLAADSGTYNRALVCFNLGYCCLRQGDERGEGHLVATQRLLEEAADEFETAGQRERAFDCYQVLLEIGRRSGVFENLAEGYINCIRILKEDGLKYYVLQYYEDFLSKAIEREEFHAAASLYQEAADYCLRTNLLYDLHYLRRATEAWVQAAEKNRSQGGPAELSENAYLAAVECANTIGDYQMVGKIYSALSELDLLQRKKERYQSIAERYQGAAPTGLQVTSFPDYLRQAHPYPDIWNQDLVELQHDGDVESVCAAVVGDKSYPDVVRRKALCVLLDVLEPGGQQDPARLAQVAEELGDLQIYVVLRPLERLFEHESPLVHQGVMKALRYLFFKRTFGLLRRGLIAENRQVREEAIKALGRLFFRHAFDQLVRIFREHTEPQIRITALASIGQIQSLEAGDFLIEVLRHEPEPLRSQAKQLLKDFQNREICPILRQHAEMEPGPVASDLLEILQSFGE